jgi:hypothetical protein
VYECHSLGPLTGIEPTAGNKKRLYIGEHNIPDECSICVYCRERSERTASGKRQRHTPAATAFPHQHPHIAPQPPPHAG